MNKIVRKVTLSTENQKYEQPHIEVIAIDMGCALLAASGTQGVNNNQNIEESLGDGEKGFGDGNWGSGDSGSGDDLFN